MTRRMTVSPPIVVYKDKELSIAEDGRLFVSTEADELSNINQLVASKKQRSS